MNYGEDEAMRGRMRKISERCDEDCVLLLCFAVLLIKERSKEKK
jgi:hypothetical protein